MTATVIRARRYDTGEPVQVTISGGTIAAIETARPDGKLGACPFVAPGLFDLQINGYGGVWFCEPEITSDKVIRSIEPYLAHGITRMCPTLITSSFKALSTGFAAIRIACEQHGWVNHVVAGCHLEGPYLSAEEGPRGAHPKEHIRPADWDEFSEFQKSSGDRIRLVTIAPEVPHAIDFIRRAVDTGVRIAIGHTAATGAQIQAAVDAGATLSTHLGNGAHSMIRRHPNYIWEQLGESRLSASIIADGQHLPDSVIRSIVFAKTVRRTILTCDASGWAGCASGVYENELGRVEVLPDGRIVVAGQRDILAGSGLSTDACVARVAACGAATLPEAIDMASRNPARYLGLPENGLRAGNAADLFIFQPDLARGKLNIVATVVVGEMRYGNISTAESS